MLTPLPVPIPLQTPKGKAWAIAIIDYGPHWDLQWVTFVHSTGECWTFLNRDIRQEENLTFGIPKPSPLHPGATPKAAAPAAGASTARENGTMRPSLPGNQHPI